MELSSKVRYALLALVKLTAYYQPGEFVQIEQIIAGQQIPERYVAQLLMTLRRCNIVHSQRGAKGGYALAKRPQEITILDVLSCLEGTKIMKPQAQSTTSTTIEEFAIQEIWHEARETAIAVLQSYTLQQLREKCDRDERSNPMYYI